MFLTSVILIIVEQEEKQCRIGNKFLLKYMELYKTIYIIVY